MVASSPAHRPWPPFPSRSLLLSGRLAAGRRPSSAAASSLPAPQLLVTPVYGPRAVPRGRGLDALRFLLASPSRRGPRGPPGLPEPAFQTGWEQGVRGSGLPAQWPLCLARQRLAGLFRAAPRGLSVDEVAGPPFPHSCSDTNGALCLRAAGGRESAQAPPELRGDANKTHSQRPAPWEPKLAVVGEVERLGLHSRRLLWDPELERGRWNEYSEGDLNLKIPVGVKFTVSWGNRWMAGECLVSEAGKGTLRESVSAPGAPCGTCGPFSTWSSPKPNELPDYPPSHPRPSPCPAPGL